MIGAFGHVVIHHFPALAGSMPPRSLDAEKKEQPAVRERCCQHREAEDKESDRRPHPLHDGIGFLEVRRRKRGVPRRLCGRRRQRPRSRDRTDF